MNNQTTLVDANVILDVVMEDQEWCDWSAAMLEQAADSGPLYINPIIYAEVCVGFGRIEDVDEAIPSSFYRRAELPWSAAFVAARAYRVYRGAGGTRRSPLPDFYIGAHAAVADFTLLTRDARRYREYFPTLRLIAP